MARARTPDTSEAPDHGVIVNGGSGAIENREDDEAEENFDIASKIRDAVSTGGRVYVRVFKKLDGGTWAACRDFTPEEVLTGDLSVIRNEFGPGLYEMRVTGPTGFLARPKVEIAASLVPPPATAPAQSETAQMLRAMLESQQAIMQRLANPAPPPPAAPGLLQQLGINNITEAIAVFSAAKSLFTPAAQAQAPAGVAQQKSPLEQIREVLEVQRLLREDSPGGESKEDSLISLLPQVLETIKTAASNQQAGAQIPALAMPASVASAHEIAPTPTAQTDMNSEINVCMATAHKMLSIKKSPTEIGNYLYEYLPDEAFALFNMPNWLDMLIQSAPQFAGYRDELTAAHAQIVQRQASAGS